MKITEVEVSLVEAPLISSLGGNEVNINSLNQNKANYREDLATTITGIASLF